MDFTLDNNGIILGYSAIGSIEDGVRFDGELPDGFESEFKPSFYLLRDGAIVVNPNYTEPSEPGQSTGPTAEQKLLMQQAADTSQLKQLVMAQASDIASLTKESAK